MPHDAAPQHPEHPGGPNRRGLLAAFGVFAVAALVLSLLFRGAAWRAETVSLPRYCDDPDGHVARVEQILAEKNPGEKNPVADRSRRAYVIAAKLIYLEPRAAAEPLPAYLDRLRRRIRQSCR